MTSPKRQIRLAGKLDPLKGIRIYMVLLQRISKRMKIRYVLLTFLLLTGVYHFGQQTGSKERGRLEAQQKRIRDQLAVNQKLLNEARKNREASMAEVNLLNSQIGKRVELIRAIEAEISYLHRRLQEQNQFIARLELDLERLRTAYSKSIYLSYKLRATDDRLLFLLASESLNQAWSRARFLQRLASGRRKVYEQLLGTHEELEQTALAIKEQLQSQERLRDAQRSERNQLSDEKEGRSKVVTRLQREETRILAEIRKQQREASELQDRIAKIIQEEMRRAAERQAETTQQSRQASVAEIKLSNTFAANKGKLPWPIEQGSISGTFGAKKHPVFDIYTENNGIDFITQTGASARSVFDGEVSEVIQLPAYYAVLIKHGDYFTLYSKLQTVLVRKGQQVTTGEPVGQIRADNDVTEFHFEVWHGKQKQNPQEWIRR
jgi:murein hydrolase activator